MKSLTEYKVIFFVFLASRLLRILSLSSELISWYLLLVPVALASSPTGEDAGGGAGEDAGGGAGEDAGGGVGEITEGEGEAAGEDAGAGSGEES